MQTIAIVALRLNARAHRKTAGQGFPALLAMQDRLRLPDPTRFPLPPGTAVIYRSGDLTEGKRMRVLCHKRGIPFFWAGHARDALRLDADGLHLRDETYSRLREVRIWRRRHVRGPVFMAAHDPVSFRACCRAGADAVLLSPVFPTRSHPGAPCIGLPRFRLWTTGRTPCVYALGGVTAHTVRGLFSTRCIGIAGIDWMAGL